MPAARRGIHSDKVILQSEEMKQVYIRNSIEYVDEKCYKRRSGDTARMVKDNIDKVVFWWRTHPLIEAIIKSMKPELQCVMAITVI